MTYFVFDMDATLANLYTVHYFLCDLRRETMIEKTKTPSEQLQMYLNTAYTSFVQKVASKEAQAVPYGILRPGILAVMKLLNTYKKSGTIQGVVIYSNNAALGTLHFIRDVIHAHIGNSSLICDCIHWGHEARDSERKHFGIVTPGAATKTWNVLKTILINGNCTASNTIEPKDVYFIDDQLHPDLEQNLPIGHYIQVSPYEFKTPYDPVSQLYTQCLEESGLFENKDTVEEYFEYINEGCLKTKVKTIASVLSRYKSTTRSMAVGTPPPPPDRYISNLIRVIESTKQNRGGTRRMRLYKKRGQSRRRKHGRHHSYKAFR